MPEGPEIRRYADMLSAALTGQVVRSIEATAAGPRTWLQRNSDLVTNRVVESVRSHGQHIIIAFEEGVWFHAHLRTWGRWLVAPRDAVGGVPPSPREHARILSDDTAAILYSAVGLQLGVGDPFEQVPELAGLGPDVLPYPDDGPFDGEEFRRRLNLDASRMLAAALLDERVVAGIGCSMCSEILYVARLNPSRLVGELHEHELHALSRSAPMVAARAYATGGRTIDPADVSSAATGRDYQPRYYVFRRTDLPCLRCGSTVHQRRFDSVESGVSCTLYYCPSCQHVFDHRRSHDTHSRSGRRTGSASDVTD